MSLKLKPSENENKRYLSFELEGNAEEVLEAIKDFEGALGMAKASPILMKVGKAANGRTTGIVAINREELDKVRASFAVAKKQILIKKVSGTIAGLER